MNRFKHVLVPVASFALAVLLATLASPPKGAYARKFADPTVAEECVSDLKNARGRAKAKHLHIDAAHPAQSTGSVRTRTIIDLRSGAVTGGTPLKTDNIVTLASELQFVLSGTHADGSPATETLTLSLTPIDGFGVETFEHKGITWERNLEAQFHESGDDLARLLHATIRVRKTQGDTLSYDSNTYLLAFKQVTASATHLSPSADNEVPCATDLLSLPLVLVTYGGFGFTTGILVD